MTVRNKQKVNDKCVCGSSKKYKKCCKFTYSPAFSIEQSIARNTLNNLMKDIKEPHCKICGDNEKILKLSTSQGDISLCYFCYNIQKEMV